MPMYSYTCLHCNVTTDEFVKYEEREGQLCRMCNSVMDRHFPSPRPLTASWPDGMKRPGWSDVKEISKLKVDQASISEVTPKGREERRRIKETMMQLSNSAEKQIRAKKPQEDIVVEKSKPSRSED